MAEIGVRQGGGCTHEVSPHFPFTELLPLIFLYTQEVSLLRKKRITCNDDDEDAKWGFPGGPVVRTPRFHCGGHGFHPSRETKIPHGTGQPKKKRMPSPRSDSSLL